MGGKGKKGIAQIAKRQEKALKEAAQKQKKEAQKVIEKKEKQALGIMSHQILNSIKNEIRSSPYLSAWIIASKFGIPLGEAKRILLAFEKEGVVRCVYRSSRNPIFVAA